MTSHAAILLTVLVTVVTVVTADSEQDEPQVYCGRRLASVLSMLCENGLVKRSESRLRAVEEHAFPWIPHHRARSLSRSKRQVVSECCLKPCTINELVQYCRE